MSTYVQLALGDCVVSARATCAGAHHMCKGAYQLRGRGRGRGGGERERERERERKREGERERGREREREREIYTR